MKLASRSRVAALLGGRTPIAVRVAPVTYVGTVVCDDACAFVLEAVVDDAPMLAAGRYRYLKSRGFEPTDVSQESAADAVRVATGIVDGWGRPVWRGERGEVELRIGRQPGRYRSGAGQELRARRYRAGRQVGYLDEARAAAFLQPGVTAHGAADATAAKPVRFARDGRTLGILMPLRDDGSFEPDAG